LYCVQSKSLVGDSSIVFSPPSIVAETLHDDTVFESKKSSIGLCNSRFQVASSSSAACVAVFWVCMFRVLVHGQLTIIFIVSVGLSVCLFVQRFSQPSLIRFRSN